MYFDLNYIFVSYSVSFKSINATQLHRFNSHAIYLFYRKKYHNVMNCMYHDGLYSIPSILLQRHK